MEWYLIPWQKYAVFTGRARRKEYWTFHGINWVITSIGQVLVDEIRGNFGIALTIAIIFLLFSLSVLVPDIAVTVRRLHDTNRRHGIYYGDYFQLLAGLFYWFIVAKTVTLKKTNTVRIQKTGFINFIK